MIYSKVIKFDNKLDWELNLKKTNSTLLESSYNFCNIFKNYLINTEPEIFYFESNKSKCSYTYLKSKTLIGDCYHIHSPYCYGGFSTNDESENFFSLFRENFVKYCHENRIVSEFIRLNPITHKENFFYKNYFDYYNKHCVNLYADLQKGYKIPLRENTKRLINSAKKNSNLNFTFDNSEKFQSFFHMYNSNMEIKNIKNFFNFDEFFFENLYKCIKNDFYFPTISLNNKIIAGAIFLKNEDYLDLYLAASYPIAKEIKGCNHLLFHKFFSKIYNDFKKIKLIHLGGGSDKLKFFKNSFAKEECDYFVIKNIINKDLYEKILKIKISNINYNEIFPDKKLYNYNLAKYLN